MIQNDIFQILSDDTRLSTHMNAHDFFFVFFEEYIRSNTNMKTIYRNIYTCNWMINMGLDSTLYQYYKNKDIWMQRSGICEIEMIGPFRNPKVIKLNNVTTRYIDLELHHIHIVRIKDNNELILY